MGTASIDTEISDSTMREEFIAQYNKELDDAEKEVELGHYFSQEDLETESEKW